MKVESNRTINLSTDYGLDKILENDKVKIVIFLGIGLGVLYASGFIMKIASKSIYEYKVLKEVIKS